mmetsp:Transcript_39176/g.73032  ORF Transcript_39176/g.73032 Transcript_39176/m.73032 type:complete len:245 (-) Transcript_39176:88-822(-)
MEPDSREVRLDPLLQTEEPGDVEQVFERQDDDFAEPELEGPSSFEVETELHSPPPFRKFAAKVVVTLITFMILTFLIEVYAKEAVHYWSTRLMKSIGLPGLFMAVLVGDGVPQPLPYVPLIYIAVQAAVPKVEVFAVCATGSYFAAVAGYGAGFVLVKMECYQKALHRLSAAQPWLPDLMQRKGAAGVALAALMPIPLAVATWTAGSFRVNFPQFLVAAAFRMPKILVFVLLSGSSLPPPGRPV